MSDEHGIAARRAELSQALEREAAKYIGAARARGVDPPAVCHPELT